MNRVLAHTGATFPIVQAPMGWIARSQLASAVCQAGGLGIIETSSGETDACMAEIEKMKTLTDRPFGVNLPLLFLRDPRMVEFVATCGVKFVTTSAGSPSKLLEALKGRNPDIVVYHVVPTLKAAIKAVEAGVDGLIVEGAEGGGFKNPDDVSTLVLLQAVRQAVDVPLIAAGGICDGRGMAAAFALGAEGIQMGTRFVSSAESPVHRNYKQAILDAPETGTLMLNKAGTPCVRALKTQRSHGIYEAGTMPKDTFGKILDLYFGGDMEASIGLAGQTAGLIEEIKPVRQIIDETVAQFRAICGRMAALERSASFG
ncbi:MAG: NAD(P)H-dependent flavin oxidoreductase [Reyranellaceae bacterium]